MNRTEAAEIMNALSATAVQAEKLLFMAESGYEFGAKTSLDVKDAQMNLMAARGSQARAQRDYRVAWVNLEWVSGTPWRSRSTREPLSILRGRLWLCAHSFLAYNRHGNRLEFPAAAADVAKLTLHSCQG